MTYIVSLPNPGTEGKPKFLRNGDIAARWLEAENRPGFGIYYSPNPLKPGATTHGKDIDAIAVIFVDIDFKGVVETPEEIFKVLTEMQHLLAPSFIVESGHGYHVGYVLKEPVRHNDPDFERVCDMQEVLISYLAADPVVRPWSLLRLPGTLNSKLEPHVQCREIVRGAPVDLTEVTDLCEIIKGTTALTYKDRPAGNGSAAGPAAGEGLGVDADSELANIHHGNINTTWSRVMGSALRKGTPADDIYRQILTATQDSPACQSDPGRGKWTSSLANMMTRYIRDNREFALNLSPHVQVNWQQLLALGKYPKLKWRSDLGEFGQLYVEKGKGTEGLDAEAEQPDQQDGNGARADHTKHHEQQRPKFSTIEALPFVAFNPAELAAREWLYGGHYQRAILTATVGSGGGGKSSLGLVELIAMCTARNLLGEQPLERAKVWYHNAEETITELHRRIAAVCQHYGIPQTELEGWLFVTSGIEMPIKIATNRNGKLLIDATATEAIIRTITDNGISVACFDPLIAHHTGVENVTGDMDQILREFARIAYVTDCSTEIVHHTRKPAAGQEELSVYDSRGAGAIKDAVRSMRVLNTMSKAEADKVGIDDVDRLLHFRIDRGKANMVPPTAARWRKFLGIDIPNGDNVGVVTEWTYPTEATLDIPDALCTQIQIEVSKKEYRAAAQSPDWIGKLIGRLFRLDLNTKRGKATASRHLEALYNKGVITVADGSTGRHKVNIVLAGTWKAAA